MREGKMELNKTTIFLSSLHIRFNPFLWLAKYHDPFSLKIQSFSMFIFILLFSIKHHNASLYV